MNWCVYKFPWRDMNKAQNITLFHWMHHTTNKTKVSKAMDVIRSVFILNIHSYLFHVKIHLLQAKGVRISFQSSYWIFNQIFSFCLKNTFWEAIYVKISQWKMFECYRLENKWNFGRLLLKKLKGVKTGTFSFGQKGIKMRLTQLFFSMNV